MEKIKRLKLTEEIMDKTFDIDIVGNNKREWKVPVVDRIEEKGEWFEMYHAEDLIMKINRSYVMGGCLLRSRNFIV